MKKRYWLHYFSQRRMTGQSEAFAANEVSRLSPAAFLHSLITDFPDNENRMLWSTEISAAEFKKLDGQL